MGPAISVAIAPRAGIVPLGLEVVFGVTAVVHSNVKGPAKGSVRLDLPTGWKSQPASADFAFTDDGQEQSMTFQVSPENLAEKPYQIQAIADYSGHSLQRRIRSYRIPGPATLLPLPAGD